MLWENYCLNYVTKGALGSYWIFEISDHYLQQILSMEGSYTILEDSSGQELFTLTPVEEEHIEIVFHSPVQDFRLIRHIDKNYLFAEFNTVQNTFMFTVLITLMAGGLLTMLLSYYNELPIKKLLTYSTEKVQHIPDNLGGLDAFQYAMKSMEEQLVLSEKRAVKNRVLLHLIYGNNVDMEYLQKVMEEEQFFVNTECYRVIFAVSDGGEDEVGLSKLELYLNMLNKPEYEFHLIHMPDKNAIVMIVGMSEKMDKSLEKELTWIAGQIEDNINEKVCFFVGGKYTELRKIHSSYTQALTCSQRRKEGKSGPVIYYTSTMKKGIKIQYPKVELNELYDALIEIEEDKAFKLTDKLIGILKEYQYNRFASVTLYYDILNTYYRAQARLELDMESEFLETDLLEVRGNPDAIQMLQRIQEQYRNYVEKINTNASKPDRRKEKVKKEEMVSQVIAYIEENKRNSDLSASMVSDYFGISISLMSHKFKEVTNRTVLDYITEKKFSYVCELLVDTEYSIKEIAFMTGYSSPISFIRKFRQQYGVTPVEYRMKYSKKP